MKPESVWAEEHEDRISLGSEQVHCAVARSSGVVCTLSAGREAPNVLTGPVAVVLTDVATDETFSLASAPTTWQTHEAGGQAMLSFTQDVAGSGLSVRTTVCVSDDLTWAFELRNGSYARREITVTLELPGLGSGWRAFLPSPAPHPRWAEFPHRYGYRCDENTFRGEVLDPDINLVIPSVTFYRDGGAQGQGSGLTIMSPLESPIQPFGVVLDPSLPGVRVCRRQLRIEPRAAASTALRIGFHEADWRPGLAYITSKCPGHFEPADANVAPLNGGFVYSQPAPDAVIQQWKARGVRWTEVHGIHPFHGTYVHDRESWVAAVDDHWHCDKSNLDAPPDDCPLADAIAYVESRHPKKMSRARVRDYIQRLHNHGIKAFLYFMPTEVLGLHVFESFPQDAILDAWGRTVRNWHELIVVNPDPDRPWGQHVQRMLTSMLDCYPDADGIFLDEAYYDRLDYARDDGFSIDHGRPAYRMGHGLVRLAERLLSVLRERGKSCIWNGPYQVELAGLADGMLSESGAPDIQFLAIGNKLLSSGTPRGGLGQVLLRGMQHWVHSALPIEEHDHSEARPPDERDLPDPPLPLFEEVRQRTWVLTANPLRVPEGVEANVFRTVEGNSAVVLYSYWAESAGDFCVDLPVSVAESALDEVDQLRAVYLVSADYPGWFRLDWTRRDGWVEIVIPRHRRTSMLFLAFRGVFASVVGGMSVRTGEGEGRALLLENLTAQPQHVRLRVGSEIEEQDLVPGAKAERSFHAPADERVLISLAGEGFARRFGQTVTRLPAIEIARFGSLDGVVGQAKPLRLTVFNNDSREHRVRLSANANGLRVAGLPEVINLKAGEPQAVEVSVTLEQPGVTQLEVAAGDGDRHAEISIPAAVAATDFFGGRPLTAGCVELDLFSVDGQTDPRGSEGRGPGRAERRLVYLDGQQIGVVGSRDMARWFEFMRVEIPRPVLMTLGREATLEFHAADPGDFFMIRNIRLLLDGSAPDEFFDFSKRTGGPRAVTNRVEQVFSTCRHLHAKGEIGTPIRMTLRFDGTGV